MNVSLLPAKLFIPQILRCPGRHEPPPPTFPRSSIKLDGERIKGIIQWRLSLSVFWSLFLSYQHSHASRCLCLGHPLTRGVRQTTMGDSVPIRHRDKCRRWCQFTTSRTPQYLGAKKISGRQPKFNPEWKTL